MIRTRQLLIAPLARCIIFLTSRTKDCSLAVQDTTQESRLGNKLCAIYVEVQIWPSWYKKRLSYYRTSLICFETVERSMRDVLSIDDKSRKLFPYCGRCAKTVVLGRDFRQVLPTAEYSCKA